MLLAMDPELDNPDSDTTISFDVRPPGSFPLNSDQDSRWHAHAEHDAHLHPSHNRPHVSSHSHHRGGGHHHGHHHHHDNGRGDNNPRRSHRVAGHQPRNPNYRLSREDLRVVAARTLDAIDNGWYIPDGTDVPVDLGPKMEYTDAQTAYYTPDDEEMAAWATNLGQDKKETKILIKEYSTLVGARKLHGMLASLSQVPSGDKAEAEAGIVQEGEGKGKERVEESVTGGEKGMEAKQSEDQPSTTVTDEGKQTEGGEEVKGTGKPDDQPQPTTANFKIGVLNFASAKKPGGGFINGAQAQEESIARASTLYPSLTTPEGRKFYTHYRAEPDNAYYTHAMVYSPAVVLFRGDMGDWKKPIDVDVLTSAAVNAGDVREGLRRDLEMHSLRVRVREAELKRRADFERMWEEKERKRKESEERKAAQQEKKAAEEKERKALQVIKPAEEITPAEEIKAVEETNEAGVKDKDDRDKSSGEVGEEKAAAEIKSDPAEKVELNSVERTSTQQIVEGGEGSTVVDAPKGDVEDPDNKASTLPSTSSQPSADPEAPSEPLEPDSVSSPPAVPPKPLESDLFPLASRRTRPTFPPLRDLPPPPSQTLEEAEVLIAQTMYERIARLLFLFHQRGAMHLILGSFGTGVFQNHVGLVADIFYQLLAVPGAPFEGKFETVVFAILGGATVSVFRDVFGEKAAPDGPDELDGEDSEVEGMKDGVVGGPADPRGEDGKADEPAQSAEVPQQEGTEEEKGMVVDQDVQTDTVMGDEEAAKATDEPQDVEMVSPTDSRTDADSTSEPVAPMTTTPATTTTTTDAQTQT
ncbi:hypothetical protein M413DRAFT_341446 [Hebeloma cylindrosporum]|uniref:Microbial-type PARG catalytic domain-containing protein n=1 Tax=Hebeloma cylindrosporum TaxID=76867 RepID=A0A0C2Y6I9_HEBCY|nr:hypothetical protein M413DRAFT_341446 [Hebeloma cylindrosporum h7]